MRAAPIYKWVIEDFRMGLEHHGVAPTAAAAQGQAVSKLRAIGRSLDGIAARVDRPSGGGWFCRPGKDRGFFTWEEWEPLP